MHQAGKSPLLAACEGGHNEIAKLLVDKRADVNMVDRVSWLDYQLNMYVSSNSTWFVTVMIYCFVHSYTERSPLLAACEGGHTEIALMLIDKGADVSMADKVYVYV